MEDFAHRETDGLINDLNKKLDEIYSQASSEMEEKVNTYFKKFETKDQMKFQQFQSGQITKKEYNDWQLGQIQIGKRWDEMRKTLAHDLNNTNNIAVDLINGYAPTSYALNHNYATFQVERDSLVDTSYSLYSHRTVENLIKDNPDLLPEWKIDEKKDYNWNYKRANNAIVQGVLQGESLKDVSKRFSKNLCGSNKALMNTFARTGMTGAQNRGRMDAYKRAKELGMDMKKVWLATLDGRTRHSHRNLDGETIDIDKAFSNKCDYPGDPHGPAHEVYNCRCTLLCQPKGIDYNVSDLTSRNNKLEGMSYNEWKNKHKKDLDEALPDSMISNAWSGKKYGYVYNLIKNSDEPGHGADANNFFNALKDLGQEKGIGNPPKVWTAYLNGELDDTDIVKIESVIKKYAGEMITDDNITDTAKAVKAADNISDTISDKAQKELDKITVKAGKAMDKDEADTYKVNPLYDKDNELTTKNCQTTSFAYECRRQGYDVEALPKDPALKTISNAQDQLASDSAKGWVNKVTGKEPEKLILHKDNNFNQTYYDMLKELDDAIGNSDERYILSFRVKNKTGSHAVNVDRTADGKLRIIDNQRGPLEKNTWVGIEVEDYLQDVKNLKQVIRTDDCVPKASYFNKIVKAVDSDSSDITPTKVNLATKIKNDLSGKTYTEALDNFDDKIAKEVKDLIENICDDIGEDPAKYWSGYIKGKFIDPDLDDILKDAKIVNKTPKITPASKSTSIVTKGENELDMDLIKTKTSSNVWKELNDAKLGGGKFLDDAKEIGQKYGGKAAKAWEKYLAGELDADDTAKIEKHLIKLYAKSDDNDIDDITKIKKALPNAMVDLDNDQFNEAEKIIKKYYNSPDAGQIEAHYYQWKQGLLDDDNLDELFSKVKAKTTDKVDDDFIEFKKNLPKYITDIQDTKMSDIDDVWKVVQEKYNKNYGKVATPGKYWEEWVKGNIDDSELDDIVKKKLYKTTTKVDDASTSKSDILIKALNVPNKDDAAVSINIVGDYIIKDYIKDVNSSDSVFDIAKKYIEGKIDIPELDKHLESLLNITLPKIEKTPEIDFDLVKTKKVSKVWNELKAQGGSEYSQFWKLVGDVGEPYGFKKSQSKTWDLYVKGQLKDDEKDKIEDFLKKHYFKEKTDDLLELKKSLPKNSYIDALNTFDDDVAEKIWDYVGDELAVKYKKGPNEIWQKYLSGEIKDDKLDNILKSTITKSNKPDIPEIDPEQAKKLKKAEEKLKKAEDKLEAAKEELKKNIDTSVKWKGIWKDDVTLDDYAEKKSSIAFKKQFYYDKIEELEHELDDPDSWALKKYGGEAGINKKIAEFEKYIDDLVEYEQLGQYSEKYYDAITKAEKAVTKAEQEVQKYSPSPFSTSYSQERKDAALWPKSRGEANKLFMSHSQQEWDAATQAERDATYRYTHTYHCYNEPLRGIEYGTSRYLGVGKTDLNAGYANNGKHLNAMTDYLEKCRTENDQWLQRGVYFSGADKFLNIDMDLLQYGTEKELQDALLGTTPVEYAFMSCGSAKGKGFAGDILYNIFIPKGTKASYAELYSAYKGGTEVETILQQGSKFVITKVEKKNGQIYMDLELIDQLPPQRWVP